MTIIYLVFILFAAYFSYRYDGIEEYDSHKNHRFWFLCGCLICISGFSYGLGGDKFVYMDDFENMPSDMSYYEYASFSLLFKGYMPGWSILVLWVKRTFDSFYALQFVQAIIVNVSFCYFVQKYTKRCFMFLLLYFIWLFFIYNTEVMREGVALAACMFGMEYYMHKKYVLYVLLAILGILFHISAVVVFLFPFFSFRFNWRLLLLSVTTSFAIWFLSDVVLSKLFVMALGGTGQLTMKVLQYSSLASTFFGFARNCLKYLVFPYVIMYYSCQWETSEEVRIKKCKIFSFALVLSVVACSMAGFYRFYDYIEIFYLCMLADFAYMLFKVKEHLIIRSVTLFGTLSLLFLNHMAYVKNAERYFFEYYIPYTSILDEEPSEIKFRKLMHNETAGEESTDKNQRNIKD